MEVIVRGRDDGFKQKNINHLVGKLSQSERQVLQHTKEDLEEQLREMKVEELQTGDKAILEKRLRSAVDALAKDDDLVVRGKGKDAATKKMQRLATEIRLRIPPMNLQRAKEGTPEWAAYMKWTERPDGPFARETTIMCQKYQELARQLNPGDPDAGAIDVLVG